MEADSQHGGVIALSSSLYRLSVCLNVRLICVSLDILELWHEFRYLLVFGACIASIAIYIYVEWRSLRTKDLSSPFATTPDPGSGSAEKPGWLKEKPQLAAIVGGKMDSNMEPAILDAKLEKKLETARARVAKLPKRVNGYKALRKSQLKSPTIKSIQPLVFFSSLTGTTESRAKKLIDDLRDSSKKQWPSILNPMIMDLSYIDYDDFFVTPPPKPTHVGEDIHEEFQYFYLLLLPSYNIDTALDTFLTHLRETHNDFRIDTAPLSGIAGYSVFGFGDQEGWSTEAEGFCSQAIDVDRWMAKLTGRKRAFPLGLGDVKSDAEERLREWADGVTKVMLDISAHGGLGEGVMGSGEAIQSDEEESVKFETVTEAKARRPAKRKRLEQRSNVDDLEDLGGKTRAQIYDASVQEPSLSPLPIDFTSSSSSTLATAPPAAKAMVPASSPTYAALTKQGYTIIGSHSGVKICRWTKSALRGRGSGYKYSFDGINSHLCMETTPSLSCSNKCVFCWRHGTNPVGTTWRWEVDPPELIFKGAKEGHYQKIKMMRGVPGVRAERFQEAMKIRHCALSLVGEPIFYPHINEFVALLHKEHISSFLVCNAQHPDQLAALKPVTQLYVSIDASNAESLRKIDRPLHRDYWQRFLRCLDILREKRFRMRTVFRLTLVKGFNIEEEVEGYADLVALGLPCFVEIKGVTYCGTSSNAGAGLTMQNVPFYSEISTFVEALNAALERRGLEYGIAAEHAHSCCVLIASKRFFVQGKWHTLIDYEKFFECLESRREFSPEDYMGPPTPEWATWGKGGFDPADERVDRKGRPKMAASKPG